MQKRVHPTANRAISFPPANGGRLSFARLARSTAPSSSGVARGASASPPRMPAADDARGLYEAACRYLETVFHAVRQNRPIDPEPGRELVERMAAAPAGSDPLFSLALHRDDPLRYSLLHSVNVAIYAVRLAPHLGIDAAGQVELGLAGLLHDVGMARIPETVIAKKAPLDPAERELLRGRPLQAYAILQALGAPYAFAAECAAQVCERLDGSGYPRGLKADEIGAYAQVIGLLDLYEALVHSRPNRERVSYFEAVKYIFKSCKTQFRRQDMKALLRLFTMFPIHSYVRLNSDAIGQVIETYPDQPMRPKLRIVYDSQRRRLLTERIVNLADTPLLHIAACVSEKEIRQIAQQAPALPTAAVEPCPVVEEPIV